VARSAARGRLNLLAPDGRPSAYEVRVGITDGAMTELLLAPDSPLAEVLREGATVIVGVGGATGAAPTRSSAGPRPPF
jgi:hypothetical protein